MESVDRFAETAKIRGTKGSNLVSGTIISVVREANIVIKTRRPLRMPAAKIRRNDVEIFDLPSPNICSRTRCRSWLNQRKKEFSLLFNHFRKIDRNSLNLIQIRSINVTDSAIIMLEDVYILIIIGHSRFLNSWISCKRRCFLENEAVSSNVEHFHWNVFTLSQNLAVLSDLRHQLGRGTREDRRRIGWKDWDRDESKAELFE